MGTLVLFLLAIYLIIQIGVPLLGIISGISMARETESELKRKEFERKYQEYVNNRRNDK